MTQATNLPAEVDLLVARGTDNEFEFVLTDGEHPLDLTAATVRLTVLDKPAGTVLLTDTNLPGEHSDPTNGKTNFTLPVALTELGFATAKSFWPYEVRRLEGGEEHVHIAGLVTVHPVIGA